MEFNPDKCEVIRITTRRKNKIVTNYSIPEQQLKEVKGANYLGVTIDRTLATGCPLREERLPSTQQCDHAARKPELGVPCEQASGSQARNVVPHYKQLSGGNNIRTHSRSYTHQGQHTPLLTISHPHRSLQTLLLSQHHQYMEQCTQQLVSKQSFDSFRRHLHSLST